MKEEGKIEKLSVESMETFKMLDEKLQNSPFNGNQQIRRMLYSYFIFKPKNIEKEIKIFKKGETIKSILINVSFQKKKNFKKKHFFFF